MPPVPVHRDLDRPEEVDLDLIRTGVRAVMRENTVDLRQALTVDHAPDHDPGLIPEVVVAAGLAIGVTTAKGNSDRTTTAVLTTNLVSKVSITRTIAVVAIISRTGTGSTTISITIGLVIDVAVGSITVVAVGDAAVTVAADSSTVSRASATSGIGETSGIVVPPLVIDTAIVATHLTR